MIYFEWLENQVLYFDDRNTYHKLLSKLHSLPYISVIEQDENRASDGIYLRNLYFGEYDVDRNIIDSSCSFFEFLLGLARRMNFVFSSVYEDRTKDCFWTLIRNMTDTDPTNLSDDIFGEYEHAIVCEAVDRIIYRKYHEDGTGGLFPLKHPRENQRNVEVWYQMNQYLAEAMSEEERL